MARTAFSKKSDEALQVPPHKRWTVVLEETGRRVYLASPRGLNREGAEALSERLAAPSRVVPEAALDRYGCFQPELLEEAVLAAEQEEE